LSTKPYDQAFKYLAEQDAESLLILLGYLQPGQRAEIELLPRELGVATRLPDQPYRVVTTQGRRLVHVEAQTVYDSQMPERMADYGARLWMTYRLPLSSYVLLLTERGLPQPAPTTGRIEAGDVQILVRYQLVRLRLMSAARVLALERESLLPFVPLMEGGQAELETGARRLGIVADERRRRDLSLHFLVLGGLRYNHEDLLDLIGRTSMIPLEQLKESSFYQFIAKEGLKEGLQQGLQQGEIKAAAEILRLLAAKRFPELRLGAEVERIHDVAALQQLCLEINDLPDATALEQRVAELAASSKE